MKDSDILNDSSQYANVVNTLFLNDVRLIRTFEDKISEIGNVWLDKKLYTEAIAVFKLNVKVTPNSWNALNSLAIAYLNNDQVELALTNFEKSIEINPDNDYGKQQIKEIKRLVNKL